MIGSQILEFLDQLATRKFADEELVHDLALLRDELSSAYQSLNSFDEYASEVKSGKLRWSPPHTSALFWQENVARLEENGCEILHILYHLLSNSTDPVIVSVAANDLGEYVKNRPTGKKFKFALISRFFKPF